MPVKHKYDNINDFKCEKNASHGYRFVNQRPKITHLCHLRSNELILYSLTRRQKLVFKIAPVNSISDIFDVIDDVTI